MEWFGDGVVQVTQVSVLTIYTVYQNPRDKPDAKWAVRPHFVPGGIGKECRTYDTLEAARADIPPGLFRMPRDPNDDPVIYETWF